MTYLYPDHLKARATLWLWDLRDIGLIGIGALLSIACLSISGILFPLVLTAVYGFLSIQFDGTRIWDFILYACAFFVTRQQSFDWGDSHEKG